MAPFEFRDQLHRPDPAYLSQTAGEAEGNQRLVAFIIGLLAIWLAIDVNVLDIIHGPKCARSSISHYFYEPVAGTFFVMALTFVAAFLLAYRGECKWDARIASVAGVAALLVAFFPTSGAGCHGTEVDLRPDLVVEVIEGQIVPFVFEGSERMYLEIADPDTLVAGAFSQRIHWGAAVILFAVLLYFSAFVFTRVREGIDRVDGVLTRAKKVRNLVYLATSLGMLISFGIILFDETLASLRLPRPVFIGEALALCCFGIAWLVKGRFWLRRL